MANSEMSAIETPKVVDNPLQSINHSITKPIQTHTVVGKEFEISSCTLQNRQDQRGSATPKNDRLLFTTMGMFIIDEIHYGEMSSKPPVYDIIGGAGTYSVLGCRFFFPANSINSNDSGDSSGHFIDSSANENTKEPSRSQTFVSGTSNQIGWIIDVGYDFPEPIRNTIEGWNTGVVWRNTPDRQTTRGWNYYGLHEERGMLFSHIFSQYYMLSLLTSVF